MTHTTALIIFLFIFWLIQQQEQYTTHTMKNLNYIKSIIFVFAAIFCTTANAQDCEPGTRIKIEKPQQWDIVEVLDLIPDCIPVHRQAELRAELEVLHGKIYDYVLKESPDITVQDLYRQCAEGCWGWLDIKCRTGKWNQ